MLRRRLDPNGNYGNGRRAMQMRRLAGRGFSPKSRSQEVMEFVVVVVVVFYRVHALES